jgi:Flp pilus assembly protein TadB
MDKVGRKCVYDFDLLSLIRLRVTKAFSKVPSGISVGEDSSGTGLLPERLVFLIIASSLVLAAVILAVLSVLVLAGHRIFAHVLLATLYLSFGIRQFSLNFGERLVRNPEQVRTAVRITSGLPLSREDHLVSVEQAVVLTPC